MFRPLAAALSAFALLAASPLTAQTAPSENPATIMVLDVSNSMWGQIDGVSKIEIAREVIGDLLTEWDPGTDLGLVAYGHRRQGDCGDIETVIPVGPVEAQSFSARVNALVPRGKTPLTEAVRSAAETLGNSDRPATVILVSDGIESCNADPCALAEQLERSGVDFTAHVVGFDVGRIEDQGELSCLADLTGGSYLTAENAGELSSALKTVAAPPPPPPPAALRLEAATSADGPALLDPGIRWTVVGLDTEVTLIDGGQLASPIFQPEAGRYFARAELNGAVGSAEVSFAATDDQVVRVILEIAPAIAAPAQVEAESAVTITWQGPDRPGDFIALSPVGSPASDFAAFARTSQGSPVTLTAPATGGAYEARYVDGAGLTILATAPVEVIALSATVTGPAEVVIGQSFEVSWEGPEADGDYVTIVPLGAEASIYGAYAYTRNGMPGTLVAPDTEGPHELRYVSAVTRKVIGTAPIEVLPIPVTLSGPPEVPAGGFAQVSWDGPNGPQDFITVIEPEAEDGRYRAYTYTTEGSPLQVRVPDVPGVYEYRYVFGQSNKTLATLPVTVTPTPATLAAEPVLIAGAPVEVVWTGPDHKDDFITIVAAGADEGTYLGYAYTRDGEPARFTAPAEPGAYELRYVTGQSGLTLASLPVTVEKILASLEAVPAAPMGAMVEVAWEGPGNENDFVTIVPVGTEEKKYLRYTYTRDGNPLKVLAPDRPGPHEIRYLSGQSNETLGRLPIALLDVPVSLAAAPVVAAGSGIAVSWEGPDNQNDFVTVVAAGTEEGKYGVYAYTREGPDLSLRAPDTPGSYELRYLSGQSNRTLASLPITVQEVVVSLEAAPTAPAGSMLAISWDGPDNQNDFLTVVPVGTEEGKYQTYEYTRNGTPLMLRMPDEPGAYELRYLAGQSRMTLASLPVTVTEVTASLDAPPTAPAGSMLSIVWDGPDNQNDFLTVVPVGTEEGKYQTYEYTRKGSPLSLQMPDEPGAYELRYLAGQSRATLASLPITVTEVSVRLEAAPTASAGAALPITWEGPDNRNDFITVVPAGTEEGKYQTYEYTRKGSPLSLQMPDEPGAYELRYLAGQSRTTLASLPITITEVTAQLEAVPTSPAGAEISITWEGPDNRNDLVTVVPAGTEEKKLGTYAYTRNGSPLKLLLPDEPGAFELRYVSGQSRATLASLPITLTEITASLSTEPSAQAGAEIQVTWEGPDNRNDLITVVEPGVPARTLGAYTYTRSGSPLTLLVPDVAGSFELRYISGQSRKTLASLPITLTEITASLSAAPSVPADERFEVIWEGPDNRNDIVTIVPAGTEDKKTGNYTLTRQGSPMTLAAPKEPGAYELRYVSRQSGRILARVPITVN